ncbi:hypothetical protein EVAR_952_1 [Eumeta japonica]|uniref:Uncharacterized protein n=1 Tax=Eumeta variegata TaxID=151549 RepID=A0A4C1SDY4_EUMVA|nr:hypothetical protein EVAR_952_1 [Eumeta japonica]
MQLAVRARLEAAAPLMNKEYPSVTKRHLSESLFANKRQRFVTSKGLTTKVCPWSPDLVSSITRMGSESVLLREIIRARRTAPHLLLYQHYGYGMESLMPHGYHSEYAAFSCFIQIILLSVARPCDRSSSMVCGSDPTAQSSSPSNP